MKRNNFIINSIHKALFPIPKTLLALSFWVALQNSAIAGVRYINYDADAVPTITTAAGIASEIIFEEDEEITYYTFGFDNAWDSAVAQKHILIFKSKDEKPQTNLLVHTNKRHYVFNIVVGNDEWEKDPRKSEANYSVRIRYFDNKSVKALKKKEEVKQAKQREEQRRQESLRLSNRAIDTASTYIYKDYCYRATEHAQPIIPLRMWDNGKITFIRFPPAQKRGTIYELLPNGKTSLINYHTEKNGLVVIHGVYQNLIIRLGDEAVETKRNVQGGLMENLTKTTVPNTMRTTNIHSAPINFRTSADNDKVEIEKTDRAPIFQEEDTPATNHGASSVPSAPTVYPYRTNN